MRAQSVTGYADSSWWRSWHPHGPRFSLDISFRLCQGSSASICTSRGLAHRASSSRTARLQPSFKFMALSAGADGDWRCTITVLTPDAGCHLAHRVLIDLNKPWLSSSGFFTRMHASQSCLADTDMLPPCATAHTQTFHSLDLCHARVRVNTHWNV